MSGAVTEVKHWKRPDLMEIKREKGWGYKYVRKNDVDRRLLEGWEVCRDGEKKDHETSNKLDGAQHHRGLILMRMPQHMVDERNAYYLAKHQRRIRAAGSGSKLSIRAGDVNRETGSGTDAKGNELTGTIGKGLTIKSGVTTEEGITHTTTQHIPIGEEIDPKDVEDLQEVKSNQKKSESPKEEPAPKKKSWRR